MSVTISRFIECDACGARVDNPEGREEPYGSSGRYSTTWVPAEWTTIRDDGDESHACSYECAHALLWREARASVSFKLEAIRKSRETTRTANGLQPTPQPQLAELARGGAGVVASMRPPVPYQPVGSPLPTGAPGPSLSREERD